MQVLLVDDNPARQDDLMIRFLKSGFQITSTANLDVAQTYLECGLVDLLVMAERVGGQLAHSIALRAEHRNNDVSTILLTERTGREVDEIFELIPSVHCILADDMPPETIVRFGRGSIDSAAVSMSVRDAVLQRRMEQRQREQDLQALERAA